MSPTALLVLALAAGGPGRWEAAGSADFSKGDLEGVVVAADGAVTLGPRVRSLWRPPGVRYVWSVVHAGAEIFAGVGDGAEIWRIRRDGAASRIWKGPGAEVYALALGPDGRIWAGVSPTGAVVRIEPSTGAADSVVLGDSYVWALVGSGDAVYAATGRGTAEGGGRIFRLRADARGRPRAVEIYRAADAHVLALAADGAGGLYFGTQGRRGLVGRLVLDGRDSPSTEIVFDPPEAEVTALAVGADGVLIAATAGASGGSDRSEGNGAAAAAAEAFLGSMTSGDGASAAAVRPSGLSASSASGRRPMRAPPAGGGAGRLWRIRPGEAPERLFEAEAGMREIRLDGPDVLAAALRGGRVWRVRPDGRASIEIEVDAEAVLDLAGPAIAVGVPAEVLEVDAAVAETGAYVSEPIDAGTLARWGALDVEGEGPILLSTRSGNVETPDATWSPWSAAYRGRFAQIASPPARFLQVRAALRGAPDAPPPLLRRVAAAYQAGNRPPRLKSLSVGPFQGAAAGAAAQVQPTTSAQSAQAARAVAAIAAAAGGAAAARTPALPPAPNPYRTFLAVQWEAEDEDKDDLVGRIGIRGVGEEDWLPFADEVSGNRFVFDGAGVPDGRYEVRLEIADTPSNPPGTVRTVSRISEPFAVDNTPPTIALAVETGPSTVRCRAEIEDRTGTVSEIAYALDDGPWIRLRPEDGVADSPREAARFLLEGLPAGAHVLVVRAADAQGNRGQARAVFAAGAP